MISAQNLLQPLNGNRLTMFLLLAFLISSCSILKPESESNPSKVYFPDKSETDVPVVIDTIIPDTLEWTEIEEAEDEDMIEQVKSRKEQSDKKYGFKESYKIDILIPMDSYTIVGNLEDIEQSSTNEMLHYYGGIIMALVDLKEKGADFDVNVYDAPVDQDRMNDYLKNAIIATPDLIIGPNEKDQLKKINDFCADKGITVVSPWRAITNVSNKNPYFIQLKPSLDTYYEKMVQDIDESYSADDVFIVGADDGNGKSRAKHIQSIHLKNISTNKDYNSVFVNIVELESENPVFEQIFIGANRRKVIVLPNWSYRDEDFLFSCLRKINLEKGDYDIEVYGMPILLNSDKISYDLFKRLNIRIVSPEFLDDTDLRIKEFKADFYKQFNVFPNAEAYEGYDMMSYIGSNLILSGSRFMEKIENEDVEMLTTAYKLEHKYEDQDDSGSEVDLPAYFENKKLYILGFENNKFVKLR